MGHPAEKNPGTGAWTDYIFGYGKRLAKDTSTNAGGAQYYQDDHLGSARIMTDNAGTVISNCTFNPFGEQLSCSPDNASNHYRFTGKERDGEDGLDDFGARYFSSSMGRWISADSVNVTENRLFDPSNTLNKYVYAGNSPLEYIDHDGQDITLFYTDGGAGGHAMLLAYDPKSGDSAVQSFGPASHSTVTELAMAMGLPVQGTPNYGFAEIKSADQLRQEYSSITIQTSPEQTQQAIQYIRTHSDGKYEVYGNNCTTTCARILRDLKIHQWGEMIPNVLFTNLAAKYGTHKFEKPTDNPKHGVDYGKPRPGFDSFTSLYFAIQNQLRRERVKSKVCYVDDKGKKSCQSVD